MFWGELFEKIIETLGKRNVAPEAQFRGGGEERMKCAKISMAIMTRSLPFDTRVFLLLINDQ